MSNQLRTALLTIAKDLGNESPDGRYFEKLLGLSNGRISQIMDPQAKTSLGSASMAKLVALGYSPDWITGHSTQKLISTNQEATSDHPRTISSATKRKLVKKVCEIAETISDFGLKHLLIDAERYAQEFPFARKEKGAKRA